MSAHSKMQKMTDGRQWKDGRRKDHRPPPADPVKTGVAVRQGPAVPHNQVEMCD